MTSSARRKRSIEATFLPQEIISNILLRLPIKPLFKFKCVSKLWNSIISDPNLARNYVQQAQSLAKHSTSSLLQLWGMLYPFVDCQYDPRRRLQVTYTADDHRKIFYMTIYFSRWTWNESQHEILASSNGLVLSLFSRFTRSPKGVVRRISKNELCVSNPLTNRYVKLPSIKSRGLGEVFGFATRAGQIEGSYIAYKVVVNRWLGPKSHVVGPKTGVVEIFSSDTGSWSCSEGTMSFPRAVFEGVNKEKCFCYKGILHWLDNETKTIVTYDPFDKPNEFGQLQLPDGRPDHKVEGANLIHFGHEDVVKYCEIDTAQESVIVWRLVDYDKGEWWPEQYCRINPMCYDKCKPLVAPDPLRSDLFCHLYARDSVATEIDVAKGHIAHMNMESTVRGAPKSFHQMRSLVPIVLCPWSDPSYGQRANQL